MRKSAVTVARKNSMRPQEERNHQRTILTRSGYYAMLWMVVLFVYKYRGVINHGLRFFSADAYYHRSSPVREMAFALTQR